MDTTEVIQIIHRLRELSLKKKEAQLNDSEREEVTRILHWLEVEVLFTEEARGA